MTASFLRLERLESKRSDALVQDDAVKFKNSLEGEEFWKKA